MLEGSGLHQIGFRNRVWLVERTFDKKEEAGHETHCDSAVANASRSGVNAGTSSALGEEEAIQVTLKRWDPAAGTFPEVLLVVKS